MLKKQYIKIISSNCFEVTHLNISVSKSWLAEPESEMTQRVKKEDW